MKITVGFSYSKGWWKFGSRIIQLVEKRPFSHTYIKYVDPDTSIPLVAQASHGYVNIVNYELFKEDNVIVEEYEFDLAEKCYCDLLTFIFNRAGVAYSRLGIFLIGIKKLFHIELNIRDKDRAFICSEFVGRTCEVLGIIPPLEDQDYLTPSDLNRLIKDLLNK